MIKHIIFDLDGVLVETRGLHRKAFQDAVKSITGTVITDDYHSMYLDGLSTNKKINMLSRMGLLDPEDSKKISTEKQRITEIELENIKPNKEVRNILLDLRSKNYKLSVASNSIRSSVIKTLEKLDVLDLIDSTYSNEDVLYPKPHPEIYMLAMYKSKISPKETLIIEDSAIGRTAASESGAHVLGLRDAVDLIPSIITNRISELNGSFTPSPWDGGKMNILIPMAGAGSRFTQAGYTFPKPLIEIAKKPMIQVVVENININANYIFIVQKSHSQQYNLHTTLNLIKPNCTVIETEGVTEGAACTTLLAKEYINNNEPLLIANSDQFIKWNSSDFMFYMHSTKADGGILTFESTHPKWSYAKIDQAGKVTEVREKMPISNKATVGIYFWSKGSEYVTYAEQMIDKNIRTNNEFYVCPVFNEAIADSKDIRAYDVEEMHGLGTPEDLKNFLILPRSGR